MNPYLRIRADIVRAIRRFFDERGFTEMHTPRLVRWPGQEPHLDPMSSCVNEINGTPHDVVLITSPEYAMKKLLGQGWDRIYDLGPCFRDGEPWDGMHDPEFLLLEWYRRDAGLEELMQDTEGMLRHVVDTFRSTHEGWTFVMTLPFRRLTVAEAMKQYAGIDLEPLLDDRESLARYVRERHQTVTDYDTWDDLFFKIFLSEVEPHLGWSDDHAQIQPTFLWRYPACMAGLARRDPNDTRFALRTELYVGPYELGNGFAELADANEQRTRFIEDQQLRTKLGKRVWPIDESFLRALSAMGNAAGMAFGVDRLVMLLAGATSISDVMPILVRERFLDLWGSRINVK